MNNYYFNNPYKLGFPFSHNNYYKYNNFKKDYYYKENNINENIIDMNNFQENFKNSKQNNKWFKIKDGKIKIFNFTIESDDILLISLIIFLLLQKEKDYILIIIIGLMILNLSLDDFKDLNFLKDLKN